MLCLYTENYVRYSILAAIKSIQNRTCIKFEETQLALSNTSAAQMFAVVFSKHGNRYLLHKTMCLPFLNVNLCMCMQYENIMRELRKRPMV